MIAALHRVPQIPLAASQTWFMRALSHAAPSLS
jgi:hypothetical protein